MTLPPHVPTGMVTPGPPWVQTAPGEPERVVTAPRRQLVVTYFDHQIMYYPIDPTKGWKIDHASRCVVVGKFPRTYIPLDSVRSFDVEAIRPPAEDAVRETRTYGLRNADGEIVAVWQGRRTGSNPKPGETLLVKTHLIHGDRIVASDWAPVEVSR